MLFPELLNDGKSALKLNRVQINACSSYNEKIRSGIYRFDSMECLICSSRNFSEIGAKDRYGLAYRTVICNECGLIQSDQRLEQKSAQEFYNTEYTAIYFGNLHPSEKIFNEQYERANLIYRFLKPLLTSDRAICKPKILEVGCNAGGILGHFADRGFAVSGLDLNARAVAYASEKRGLNVQQGSLDSVALPEKADIIIYSHVLEHLSNPQKELNLIRENLKDEGLLYIEVPGIKNLHQSYKCNLLLYLQNAHIAHFSLITLRNILQMSGFEIIKADEYIRCVCRKSEAKQPKLINDKKDVLEYLLKVEELRKRYPLRLISLLAYPKMLIKQIMKFTGLYKPFFRLYHMR